MQGPLAVPYTEVPHKYFCLLFTDGAFFDLFFINIDINWKHYFFNNFGPELATWFRLKYPHIALGALASSAPVLYYEDITPHNEYYSTVTKNYRVINPPMIDVSHSCRSFFFLFFFSFTCRRSYVDFCAGH